VGGGLGTVVVGRGSVEGGFVVGGDVCGGAVVVVGGGTIWAWACQMAAAPKAMVANTTIPAARQRELTPCLFSSPALFACCWSIGYWAHSR
jgi:alanine dehydrogenase